MDNELPCSFRSPEPLGRLRCGCRGRVEAYWCSNPSLDQYVTLHKSTVKHKEFNLYRKDGPRTAALNSLKLPTCILCPHRQGASEELKQLIQHEETVPETPSAWESRKPEHQTLFVAICAGCPRIDTKGNPISCHGPASDECPQKLWPDLVAIQKSASTSTRHGCCG